jgi:hypothetical protein
MFPLFLAHNFPLPYLLLIYAAAFVMGNSLPCLGIWLGRKKESISAALVSLLAVVSTAAFFWDAPPAEDSPKWGAWIAMSALPAILTFVSILFCIWSFLHPKKKPIQPPQTTTGSSAPDRV